MGAWGNPGGTRGERGRGVGPGCVGAVCGDEAVPLLLPLRPSLLGTRARPLLSRGWVGAVPKNQLQKDPCGHSSTRVPSAHGVPSSRPSRGWAARSLPRRWSSSRPPLPSSRWCRPSMWKPRTASTSSTKATKVSGTPRGRFPPSWPCRLCVSLKITWGTEAATSVLGGSRCPAAHTSLLALPQGRTCWCRSPAQYPLLTPHR